MGWSRTNNKHLLFPQVEEMSREEGEVQVLPYVLVLHAFCLVDPGLCTPASDPTKFVITLQPYLKSQVGQNSFKFLGMSLLRFKNLPMVVFLKNIVVISRKEINCVKAFAL